MKPRRCFPVDSRPVRCYNQNRYNSTDIAGPAAPCRGGDSRARRCTSSPYKPPLKWGWPPICHCEEAQPTWQSRRTRPNREKAIGENATASPRLHPKGTSSRFALRAPRCFAPCNDTSGWCGCGNGAQRRIGTAFAASRTGAACRSPTARYAVSLNMNVVIDMIDAIAAIALAL